MTCLFGLNGSILGLEKDEIGEGSGGALCFYGSPGSLPLTAKCDLILHCLKGTCNYRNLNDYTLVSQFVSGPFKSSDISVTGFFKSCRVKSFMYNFHSIFYAEKHTKRYKESKRKFERFS